VVALQMVDDHLVADGNKGLIRAIGALTSDLEQAKSGLPLVRARRCVTGFARLLAHEPDWEYVGATAKQRPEQSNLLSRRGGILSTGSRYSPSGWQRGRMGVRKFSAERLDCGSRLSSPLISFS
jgi:hypothetical protein